MPGTSARPRPALALALAFALLGPSAWAKDETQAEHDRLSDEIDKLASRQVWSGVERKYRELERLGVQPTFDDLVHGATAARELGDVERCYQRLKGAAKLDATKDVVNWLWEIDSNYGHVELLTVPSRAAELEVAELPFDPNQRKAVDFAMASTRQDGIFVGMLPKGAYTFATQGFQVEPGLAVRIEVSPRVRRQGLIDPVIVYRDEYGNPTTVSPAPQPPPEVPPVLVDDPAPAEGEEVP
ncbi:hypothetical protein L6R53_29215 [Myxococcota bacterium]|nr:hypothetical protein [Myxococcota bacterium]